MKKFNAPRKAITGIGSVILGAALVFGGSPVVASAAGKASGGCENEGAELRSVQQRIDVHNAKPHVFTLPEEQAAYAAYNAEAERLNAEQRRAGDDLRACEGQPGAGRAGSIDESEKTFDPDEKKIAELLKAEGRQVKAVKETRQRRTPDAEVDGVPTEFKTPRPGASPRTIVNELRSAKGQADHTIINAENSGLSQAEAREGLDRFLRLNPGKMAQVRIIGDGWEINWPGGAGE